MDLHQSIMKASLANAVKFKGKANPKAVFGTVLKENPDSRKDMDSLRDLIDAVISDVNSLTLDEQNDRLLELDPNFKNREQEERAKRKESRGELPELEGAVQGKVVTRMAPEPSKYNHLGHAMSFLINYLYAKKYDGKCLLRFEDTNPEKATQEFVDAMHSDVLEYLDIKADKVVFASDHMEKYYTYAKQLIEEGHAYVCSCTQESIKDNRKNMVECPHRNQSIMENQMLWQKMVSGELDEGSSTLRLKIDMSHKNAVMRDPVIYRLSYSPHYKQGDKYKVWPMYDFENAVEECLCEVTHVFRSNEFDSRIELQHYIATLLDFKKVFYKHYGRYNVIGATTQGREIRALIESGDYIGWDDPRLVTLRALKRRGIVKEAYYELAKKIGMSKTQTNLDFSVIASVNRSLLDKSAKRFFAINDPVLVTVENIHDTVDMFKLSYHPDNEKGERKLNVSNTYYIEKSDNDSIPVGSMIRFMDAMNLKKINDTTYEFVSESYDDFRVLKDKGPLIHFVPKDGNEVHADIFMPDATTKSIICEANVEELSANEVIQFERFAFCRLDRIEEGKPIFWFTHD